MPAKGENPFQSRAASLSSRRKSSRRFIPIPDCCAASIHSRHWANSRLAWCPLASQRSIFASGMLSSAGSASILSAINRNRWNSSLSPVGSWYGCHSFTTLLYSPRQAWQRQTRPDHIPTSAPPGFPAKPFDNPTRYSPEYSRHLSPATSPKPAENTTPAKAAAASTPFPKPSPPVQIQTAAQTGKSSLIKVN
jgi:hypothetical protein